MATNPNANLDVVAIGGSMATVGIGAQVPALSGIASYAIESAALSVGGTVGVGSSIAGAIISTVGAPVAIIGGLALVGYELFKSWFLIVLDIYNFDFKIEY